jgi:hypothetical protein
MRARVLASKHLSMPFDAARARLMPGIIRLACGWRSQQNAIRYPALRGAWRNMRRSGSLFATHRSAELANVWPLIIAFSSPVGGARLRLRVAMA